MPEAATDQATTDQPSDRTRDWEQTACILCSINCGIEVRLDGRRFARIRGDKAHPASEGVTTKRGSVTAVVEITDSLQTGHASLPNGLGLDHRADGDDPVVVGAPPNELTASEDRDWLAGTPWHKHVRARIEAVREPAAATGGGR